MQLIAAYAKVSIESVINVTLISMFFKMRLQCYTHSELPSNTNQLS